MYKDIYIYPAVFTYEDDGITVEFPKLDGAITSGKDEEEAIYMAKDCLELHLYGMEEDGEKIPESLKIRDIKLEENQSIVMVRVNMKPVRDEMQNKAIKKTLTIPKWLNDAAVKQHINFSALLKSVLMDELEIRH
jgi:predicted RNase H-like HicB family nuclease